MAAPNGTLALRPVEGATRAICASAADRLEWDALDLADAMAEAVFAEVPVYRGLRSADMARTVRKHSLDHVHAVVRTIRTWGLPEPDELSFVRAQAALRAAQGLPLSALLHGYRLGHRTVWERLVEVLGDREDVLDAVLALTTLTLGYTDIISAALAEGYVEQQRHLLVELDRDRRDLLENLLLGSVGQRAETVQLAATFDLLPATELAVAVLGSGEALHGEALTRAAETVRRHLSIAVAQPFVVVRQHEVVAIVPLGRARTGMVVRAIRAAHNELSQHGEVSRRRECWAAGLSTACSSLADVPRGYEEARYAFETVVGQAAAAMLLDMRVSDYLLERADATVLRMVPAAARRLFESEAAADRALVETLEAYAEADMSARVAAQRIAVHSNTVAYRLGRIRQVLGRDPTRFSDLVELVAWARIVKKHNQLSSPPQSSAY